MHYEPNDEIKKFEKSFTDLFGLENYPNVPDEAFQQIALELLDFDQRKAFETENDLFFFFETICFPYKNEIDYDVDDWANVLLNHTIKRLIVDKAETTKLLTSIRMFYILWYGIQKKLLDGEFIKEHFNEIYDCFDIPFPCGIIPYEFLERHYPEFAEEDTKTGMQLVIATLHPDIENRVFPQKK